MALRALIFWQLGFPFWFFRSSELPCGIVTIVVFYIEKVAIL